MATLTFNDGWERQLRQAAAKRLLAGGSHLVAEAKRDLSVANPAPHDRPAPKGEFPRGRTWGGRDAVALEPADLATIAKTLTLRVGWRPDGKHLFFLWKRGWKGLADTLARVLPQLRQLLGGGGTVEGRSG